MDKEILKRISENNARGEELVKFIEEQIPILQKAASKTLEEKLAIEVQERNKQLKSDLEFWKKRVIELEILNGIEQYELPSKETVASNIVKNTANSEVVDQPKPEVASKTDMKQNSKQIKKESSKEKNKEKPNENPKPGKQPVVEEKDINVSRLDLRIGRILSAKRHPDAESLYVEEIDLGEDKPRTVVSGLVKFVPLEEMQNRLVVVLCNLKPAKMRGITSEAMVMCASTPEKVEILTPPPDSVPGDKVTCDEYPGEPDALLPPKKKIFEQVAPDLKTNGDCVATFKSAPLKVSEKGVIKSVTLKDVQIK